MGDFMFVPSLFSLNKRKVEETCLKFNFLPPRVVGHSDEGGKFHITVYIPCTEFSVTGMHFMLRFVAFIAFALHLFIHFINKVFCLNHRNIVSVLHGRGISFFVFAAEIEAMFEEKD